LEPILNISEKSDAEIHSVFSRYSIPLTPDEGRQMRTLLGRDPTLTEATIWGIQGSEHSSYKSSREYLKTLPTEGKNVLLGPGEDSGILLFHTSKDGEKYGLVVAHESHNHPSQVVPFEGAATGVGGVCRDIACMGARVTGVLDSLRFGDIKRDTTKRIFSHVPSGIGGYGNPLGVPNMGGDIFFDTSFNENCLVNVVAMGTIREKDILHSFVPKNAAEDGYEYILVGKPTDRSGFGGSSFASAVLNENDRKKNKEAVQEPNPFLERHLFAAFFDLFVRLKKRGDLHRIALKDLGAGGILCATIEMVTEQGFGAEIDVESIHTAEKNLPAAVILCAETQERFCFAVPPKLTPFILDHFNDRWEFPKVSYGACASKIGKVTDTGYYRATYQAETVCDAKALDITKGIIVSRPVHPPIKKVESDSFPENMNIQEFFLELLASENICSSRPYTETYDQTVQGNTVFTRDQVEGAIFTPLKDFEELSKEEQNILATVAVAGPTRIGRLCPKTQGETAVLQSVLKIAAVGGEVLGLTDCLNYGNPEIPEQMWEFSQGIDGIAQMAKALKVPFVSGNVSLYNCSSSGSVSPSAIIGAFGKIKSTVSPRKNAFQAEGNSVYLLGERSSCLGGSEALHIIKNVLGSAVPQNKIDHIQDIISVLHEDIVFESATVIGTGGLAAEMMKMSARSGIGIHVSAQFSLQEWFSENPGVVVEVSPKNTKKLEIILGKYHLPYTCIGVTTQNTFCIDNIGKFDVSKLSDIFWNSLRSKA
jgi:phosphoribosylformylglycinamidine synthase